VAIVQICFEEVAYLGPFGVVYLRYRFVYSENLVVYNFTEEGESLTLPSISKSWLGSGGCGYAPPTTQVRAPYS
jgi:hypothetical protein